MMGQMNFRAVRAIYLFEMARTAAPRCRASLSPVLSTSLYFVVFGAAIGQRIRGSRRRVLWRVHRAGADHARAADAERIERLLRHLFPALHRHDLRESCPRRSRRCEIVLGYVGAAATKSVIIGLIILATAASSCPAHRPPVLDGALLVLTSFTFSLFGFIIGIWADGFEKLQIDPAADRDAARPSSAARSIRSTCCRPSGRRSRCSIPWSISSAPSAGASTRHPTSAWRQHRHHLRLSWRYASRRCGGCSGRDTG